MGDVEGVEGLELLLHKSVRVRLHMMNIMMCDHLATLIVIVVNHFWLGVHAIV